MTHRRRAGLTLPQAAAAIGAGVRTVENMAKIAPQHFPRAGGRQMRIMPSSLPALRAMREDGLARRDAAARRAILIRWGKI